MKSWSLCLHCIITRRSPITLHSRYASSLIPTNKIELTLVFCLCNETF